MLRVTQELRAFLPLVKDPLALDPNNKEITGIDEIVVDSTLYTTPPYSRIRVNCC